ncbi:MAG: hypothetical protein O7D30_08920, partial [Rickettsia endosymbiont of Ixodes persulcatus]|nr:hypothetical protein [Rickettsia endosymbiont of Ixodes persulcatus]
AGFTAHAQWGNVMLLPERRVKKERRGSRHQARASGIKHKEKHSNADVLPRKHREAGGFHSTCAVGERDVTA